MEKYSVLMSVYIKEKPGNLRQALDSMLNQTVPPDEIILVEDGPLTEELYEVVNDFIQKYPDVIKTVINEKNLGLGPALNNGLKSCSNELVARMDTDDIAFPDRCEKQLAYLENHPECSALGGQIEEFLDDPNHVICMRIVPTSDEGIKEFMKRRNPINHMTVMFKKSDIIKTGSYRDRLGNEDYDLWIRLALEGHTLANLPDTLVHARVGEGMYERRGGYKYFKSEMGIHKLMLENHMISVPKYCVNYAERFVLANLVPGSVRAWIYKNFARKN